MAFKTYVLLPHTESDAPIYKRINKEQRVKFQKRPVDHAYLQTTVTLKDGDTGKQINRTIRLKLSSDTIFQDEQMKAGIPANTPFTNAEKDAVKFTNGVLTTNKEIVQKFLETTWQFDGFTGERDADQRRPLYTLFDKQAEIKGINKAIRLQARAINKVMEMEDLKEAQDLMIRLNGFVFETPKELEECQNQLADFINKADEKMLEKLLEDNVTKSEDTLMLIGRAATEGILSFTQNENQVSILKNGKWVDVKMISNDLLTVS